MRFVSVALLLVGCKIGRNTLPPCDVEVTVVDEAGAVIPDATATLVIGALLLMSVGKPKGQNLIRLPSHPLIFAARRRDI